MYRKPLFYLILISSIIRIILAYLLELGNDEVYYFTYAGHMQSNYFDHPPGIAFLIRIFTLNLHFTSEVFVRMGSVFCAAIGTLITYKIGSFLKGQRAGWISAILYNTSIYCSIIAGTFILPDSPQIIFWLSSLLLLLIIIDKIESQRPLGNFTWLLFGIMNGLCIMCKVHGIFIWGGFGLYIIFYRRSILALPGLYLSVVVTLLIISPIFWWNYSNHFVTYNYHSGRVGINHFQFDKDSVIQTILGQLFYNSPINAIISFIGIFICYRKRLIERPYFRILLFCGMPIILLVTIMSMFNAVLPHWSGPGFLTLSFLGSIYIDQLKGKKVINSFPVILKYCMVFFLIVVIGGIGFVKLYPGTIGNKSESRLGENDFTLDMYGWKDFGNSFDIWYKSKMASGQIKTGTKIICNKWFPAAHIDYYVTPEINSYVIGLGDINDLHHYVWLNNYRDSLNNGDNALCIVPSNYPVDVYSTYSKYFSTIKMVAKFEQFRNAGICRFFYVYSLSGYKTI